MDTAYLNRCIEEIKVINRPYDDVDVINHSPLSMMGKGRQGAVFRINEDICVKVFGNTDDCEREYYALSLGQHTNLFPKVYAKGSLYIAMEIIKGVDLREYLQSQPLTEELSMKLIEMLITFKEIGYERIDHHKRQIYLQPDGQLKVIDVARTVWRDRVYPFPRKLLNSLGNENKDIFLSHVQALSPELYEEWSYYMEMEQLSSQLFQKLLTEKKDKKKLKRSSNILSTPNIDETQYKKIEDLVNKVFKNEWVKVMLAQGVNPDIIMEKIDDYWEKASRERTFDDEEDYDEEEYFPSYRGFYKDNRKIEGGYYQGFRNKKAVPLFFQPRDKKTDNKFQKDYGGKNNPKQGKRKGKK